MALEHRFSPPSDQSGFTLIELLIGVGLIALMVSLTWQGVSSLQARMAQARAQSDLAVLAQALQNYRSQHGDYPWVESHTGAHEMYQALIGNRSPTGHFRWAGEALALATDPLTRHRGPAFVTLSAFTLKQPPKPQLPRTLDATDDNAFIDPWGQPYVYQYKRISKTGQAWDRPGPVLMSHGEDAEPYLAIPASGQLNRFRQDKRAADNLFAW